MATATITHSAMLAMASQFNTGDLDRLVRRLVAAPIVHYHVFRDGIAARGIMMRLLIALVMKVHLSVSPIASPHGQVETQLTWGGVDNPNWFQT